MGLFSKKSKKEEEFEEDEEEEIVEPIKTTKKPTSALNKKPSAPAAVPKKEKAYMPGFVSARVWGGRAELRYHNLSLKVLICILIAIIFATNFSWHRAMESALQKQFVVFHDQGQTGTTVGESTQFQTGPSDEEIKFRAFDTVRWIVGASSKNVDTAYGEAKRYMTGDFKDLFDQAMESRKNEIRSASVYTTLDNVNVRQLKPEDIVNAKDETKDPLTKWDMLVTGTVNFFQDAGNGDKSKSVQFAYHVKMVPADKRTLDNPSGVLVKRISEVPPPTAPGQSPEEKQAAADKAAQDKAEQDDMDRKMGRSPRP